MAVALDSVRHFICLLLCASLSTQEYKGVQWNLDLTKSLGTGQICSLNGGLVISKFFSIFLL